MKTRVFARLKPKAASFGFNDEELQTAAGYIAGSLQADATDEMIDAAIDQFAPILGLSQRASQRSFSNLKAQYEKDHPNPPTATPPATPATPPQTVTPATPAAPQTDAEMPAWFKAFKEQHEQEQNKLKEQIEKMNREKANEGFSARAIEELKEVDENYYGMMLKGRQFNSNEEVDTFVGEIKEGWNKLVQATGIQAQSKVAPPGGGTPAPSQPSQAVLDRIAERNAAQTTSPIRGLDK